ncbi:MAG: 4-fold beta flower protein [Armatimonadota bacterium]
MDPLWKINSGEFFGWRHGDDLYDAKGKHIGYFKGGIAYALNGVYMGEIHEGEWFGKPINRNLPRIGARESKGSVRSVPRARRSGRPSRLWQDPEI